MKFLIKIKLILSLLCLTSSITAISFQHRCAVIIKKMLINKVNPIKIICCLKTDNLAGLPSSIKKIINKNISKKYNESKRLEPFLEQCLLNRHADKRAYDYERKMVVEGFQQQIRKETLTEMELFIWKLFAQIDLNDPLQLKHRCSEVAVEISKKYDRKLLLSLFSSPCYLLIIQHLSPKINKLFNENIKWTLTKKLDLHKITNFEKFKDFWESQAIRDVLSLIISSLRGIHPWSFGTDTKIPSFDGDLKKVMESLWKCYHHYYTKSL